MAAPVEQQYVDPEVSRRKFDRQVADFRALERDYQAKGWFLVDATFPDVFVVMAARQVSPPALVTGVLIDYTNYDVRPPSVRLADPFTREPYRTGQLPTTLRRSTGKIHSITPDGRPVMEAETLMQGYSPDSLPFLCLPGVREYHDHPGHSGDAWELHRAAGAGTLVRLLEVIHTYGVAPVAGWQVQFNPRVGFDPGVPPL
ncbi:putative metal-binding protein [Saccharothrix variisporea]|uniref:Putative metal binding uncharacterized protein n=1 Tax=Saccharothrix variisporea TaxID=543527 RepID=A0A495XKJ0_9PSEU|nr:putative metal-binding protein [Saccharothrix variisporea]RKT74402.1 putative metal binding uncharacterized protein [Saccharothrix variisporea]